MYKRQGYYRRFAPAYAKTIEPLLELLRKNTKWRWEVRHEEAFNAVKELFKENLHVFHPKKEGTYVLTAMRLIMPFEFYISGMITGSIKLLRMSIVH